MTDDERRIQIAALQRTRDVDPVRHLHCWECGKQVSTGFVPVPTDTPDRGIIIRAVIVCPECIPLLPLMDGDDQ